MSYKTVNDFLKANVDILYDYSPNSEGNAQLRIYFSWFDAREKDLIPLLKGKRKYAICPHDKFTLAIWIW